MELDLQVWMDALTAALRRSLGARLACVGLQGSRARGEAGPQSDIDAVVLVTGLSMADLDAYRAILDTLPARDRACGFISDMDTLCAWDKAELFQFCRDIKFTTYKNVTRPFSFCFCKNIFGCSPYIWSFNIWMEIQHTIYGVFTIR